MHGARSGGEVLGVSWGHAAPPAFTAASAIPRLKPWAMDFYRTAVPWNMLLRPYGPGCGMFMVICIIIDIGAKKFFARTISKFTNGTLLHPNSDPFYDGLRAKNFSPLQVPNHLIS
jgi:hypothetical protein